MVQMFIILLKMNLFYNKKNGLLKALRLKVLGWKQHKILLTDEKN